MTPGFVLRRPSSSPHLRCRAVPFGDRQNNDLAEWFGAAVWLNGVKIGEHLLCFTAAILDVSKAIVISPPGIDILGRGSMGLRNGQAVELRQVLLHTSSGWA